jgi:hypothetical protein
MKLWVISVVLCSLVVRVEHALLVYSLVNKRLKLLQ